MHSPTDGGNQYNQYNMSILRSGEGNIGYLNDGPRIRICDTPAAIDTFVSDPVTSGEMDDGEKEKVFRRVRTMYDGAVKAAAQGIQAFIKQEFQPGSTMTPLEHFVMKQSCLGAVKLLIRLEKEKLAYDDVRQYFENLGFLLDMLTTRSQVACIYLAKLMVMSMRVVADLAGHLEDLANRQVTNWTKLASFYEEYFRNNYVEREQPRVPPLRNFSKYIPIACGSQGTVHAAVFGRGLDIMMKVVCKKKNRATNSPFNTTLVGSMSRHPLHVAIYGTFACNEAYIILMEYFSGVDCQRLIRQTGSLPTQIVTVIIAQLCLALEYLHYMGFIHRDVKPSNILMNPECRIKLCDFDTAKVCIGLFGPRFHNAFSRRTNREFKDSEAEGTLAFLAPEVLKKDYYGRSIDWWAMGVTAFALRCGRVPFNGKRESDMRKLTRKVELDWPKDEDSVNFQVLKDFIFRALRPNLKDRLCTESYQEFKSHPLFADADWALLEKADSIVSYEPAWNMLVQYKGKFQPKPDISKSRKRDKALIWNPADLTWMYLSEWTSDKRLAGRHGGFFDAVAGSLNLTYTLRLPEDYQWGSCDANANGSSCTGMLGDLYNNCYNIAMILDSMLAEGRHRHRSIQRI
ncbi:3-phosphoinositide-dependent protein kinase 2-like isoform X3 [Varroa jacobsoni]|uniref:3-phosphoinositide-dependent protein kinase 2-like isoform X3 n=1 Tax=Varroa jacobsoni TaxID=62625 RepID=UPI000BF82638|nr:3-phosphoinositide-dependent protein kinase 2-like isoform X3 [Varroa jacobsoni]